MSLAFQSVYLVLVTDSFKKKKIITMHVTHFDYGYIGFEETANDN